MKLEKIYGGNKDRAIPLQTKVCEYPCLRQMTNITWQDVGIRNGDRERFLGHKAYLVWLTGLSGSGKSTIATALQTRLNLENVLTYVLDGDNIRHGLNRDLGFSPEDRAENIRRIGEVGKLFVEAGLITISAFISPYAMDRDIIRSRVWDKFIEVYLKCPVSECERRDPKGLYKKARAGEISDFTGISAPYESPSSPEITIDTLSLSAEESVNQIYEYLKSRI